MATAADPSFAEFQAAFWQDIAAVRTDRAREAMRYRFTMKQAAFWQREAEFASALARDWLFTAIDFGRGT